MAAAGNERSDTEKRPYYPASYDLQKYLISVAGIGENGKLIPASNWEATRLMLQLLAVVFFLFNKTKAMAL